ncbi:MAG: hypothetical protein U1F77_17395 [Kiritimatiellia bacterium]
MNPPSPSPPPPATGSVPRRRFRLLVLLPAVAVAGLGLATLAGYFPPLHRTVPPAEEYQVRALQRLRERVRGVVVYERERDPEAHRGLWKTARGNRRIPPDPGRPLSAPLPDGGRLAYLRGDAEIRIMSIRGRGDRLLHTAGARIPRITFHPGGREILFLEKDEVRSLDLAGLTVRTVRQIRVPAAVDVSEDGRHIVSTNLKGRHEIHTCLLPDGEWNTLGRGCSAAISPDGRVMTDNHFDHHYLRVLQTSFPGDRAGAAPRA